MTKLPICGGLSLCALALSGCNLLHKPSEAVLHQCVTDGWIGTFDTPLSAIPVALEAMGRRTSWEKTGTNSFALHVSYTAPRTNADIEIVVGFMNSDEPAKKSSCGPGKAIVRGVSVNGQPLGFKGAGALVQQLVWNVSKMRAGQPSQLQPAPATSEPAPSHEMTLDEEAEGDAAYYQKQTELALKRPIMVTPDMTTYYCCITLQSIVDDFTRIGAHPKVTTADNGTVWLTAVDPKGTWRGWKDIELTFVSPYDEGDQLVLSSIKDGGHEVANVNGSGARDPDQILRERYSLKPTTEATP